MIDKVQAIVREAAGLMLSAGDIVEQRKEGHANFVTETDVAVQEFLRTALTGLLPGSLFFGEEQANDPLTDSPTWVVDPIDGTTNFIRGRNCSAISVALLKYKQPVLGVVYNPYADEMYAASKGSGSACNGKPIAVSSIGFSDALVMMGTTPYDVGLSRATFDAALAFRLEAADIRRSGSAAVDLCDIACGRGDVFFEMRLSPWDVAAGALIITEAGGTFEMPDCATLDFSMPHAILATNGRCRKQALAIIRNALEVTTP